MNLFLFLWLSISAWFVVALYLQDKKKPEHEREGLVTIIFSIPIFVGMFVLAIYAGLDYGIFTL